MPTVVDAESRAEALLRANWWSTTAQNSPLPVNPLALAQRLGIAVRDAQLPPDQSGMIVMHDGEGATITLNARDHENRRRFTCAHEIGHYVRRGDVGTRTFVDHRDTLAGLGVDSEEIYANQFAAAILMPAHLVQQFRDQGLSAEQMAVQFRTSVQAMNLRLRNLRLA